MWIKELELWRLVIYIGEIILTLVDQRTWTVKTSLHSSSSLIHKCQNYFPYIYHPLQVFTSSLLMKTSCLRLKLVELNFLVSFNTDDQSKTDVANAINVITYKSKSSRWTFSIKILAFRRKIFVAYSINIIKQFWIMSPFVEM